MWFEIFWPCFAFGPVFLKFLLRTVYFFNFVETFWRIKSIGLEKQMTVAGVFWHYLGHHVISFALRSRVEAFGAWTVSSKIQSPYIWLWKSEDFLQQTYKLWLGPKVMSVMLLVNKFFARNFSLPCESYIIPIPILPFSRSFEHCHWHSHKETKD